MKDIFVKSIQFQILRVVASMTERRRQFQLMGGLWSIIGGQTLRLAPHELIDDLKDLAAREIILISKPAMFRRDAIWYKLGDSDDFFTTGGTFNIIVPEWVKVD